MEQYTLLVLSSSAFEGFYLIPQFKGDKLYTKIMQKKKKNYIYIGHRVCLRAKDNRSFLPGPFIEKHYLFSECVRA